MRSLPSNTIQEKSDSWTSCRLHSWSKTYEHPIFGGLEFPLQNTLSRDRYKTAPDLKHVPCITKKISWTLHLYQNHFIIENMILVWHFVVLPWDNFVVSWRFYFTILYFVGHLLGNWLQIAFLRSYSWLGTSFFNLAPLSIFSTLETLFSNLASLPLFSNLADLFFLNLAHLFSNLEPIFSNLAPIFSNLAPLFLTLHLFFLTLRFFFLT